MSKPRKKPSQLFYALLVEPSPGFIPTNWRQTPGDYRIIKHVGPARLKGRIDTWKFLHNHRAMNDRTAKQREPGVWAIYLDLGSSFFDRTPGAEDSSAPVRSAVPQGQITT